MSSYGNFALLYDTLMDDIDYKSWGEYIELLLKYNKIENRRILEMACGTGNLTLELLNRGYQVDGFDLSNEMLAQANNKLSKKRGFRLFNMNMKNFRMDRKYHSVIAACDSINYILDEEELKETFQTVLEHLEPGGLFIFDINSEYKLEKILGNNIFLEDRDTIFYTWDNRYDKQTKICEFFLTFFHSEDGGEYVRFDEVHKEKAYSIETIESLLLNVGFNQVEKYEAFEFESPREDSERINFTAKKK